MGIFQRAHDIVQAKTNKALDAAEKPDEMLDLSYEKMLEQITQVRRALVDLAASKKRLELQEEQFQHTIDHLQEQAKQALAANREDLAKEALSRKAAAQQQIDQMEPQRQQLDGGGAEAHQDARRTAEAGQRLPDPEGDPQGPVHRGQGGQRGRREHRRHLQVVQRLRGEPPAGPGQDRHHAGPLGRVGRAARVRRAGGRRRGHRRHPEGARPGRQGRAGRSGAGRVEGTDRDGRAGARGPGGGAGWRGSAEAAPAAEESKPAS